MADEFEMKKYFPAIDEAKLLRMYNIRKAYEAGELPLSEARQQMQTQVGAVTPEEFAYAEQRFNPPGDADECRAESLKNIFDVFGDALKIEIPHLHEAHPVNTYYRENRAIREVIARMKEQQGKTFIKNPWRELMDQLAQIQVHYTRKQNQLYSYLERKGFKHPSTTMWNYDDHNRDLIKAARALLEADRYDDFLAALPRIYEDVIDLVSKEETILLPVALRMISEEEFRQMRAGDDEIGYCLIDAPVGFRMPEEEAATATQSEAPATLAPEGFAAELQALLNKYQPAAANPNAVLDVAQGKLTLDQINLIYRHMPVDLAYVDEHDRVRFYTDTKHRVFPRSAGVIGREVKHCHPPKSVHVVEEIIEKFRSGEKDFVEFWINKPGVFIYITYTAVRDKDGTYRGVLEMMQDCTHIRSLEGSRTLLHWEDDEMGKPGTNDARKKVKAKVPETEATETSQAAAVPPTAATSPTIEQPQPLADEVKNCTCGVAELELTADTKISTLVAMQPLLRERLKEIHPDFAAISNPILWNIMKHKATLGKMSERSGMPVDALIDKLRALIAEVGS